MFSPPVIRTKEQRNLSPQYGYAERERNKLYWFFQKIKRETLSGTRPSKTTHNLGRFSFGDY
jgi:hypothetical protein